MTDIITFSATSLEAFLLALIRTGGFLSAAPALNHKAVPVPVRIGLTIILSMALVPMISSQLPDAPLHLGELLVIGAREMLTGVIIGFAFALLFTGIQAAGELVGLQVGFAMANVYDPSTERQMGVLGQFQLILGLLLFFTMDGHHLMIRAFADSYQIVGVAGLNLNAVGLGLLTRLTSMVFVIAVKVAAPVMAAVFLTEIGLGIIARTVPQMNVFIIGFPLKISVGVFMLAAALPMFAMVFGKLLLQVNNSLDVLLRALVGS